MAACSQQARLTLGDAFERFHATVTPEDRREFNSTTLSDVRDAALQIERQLAARNSLRNMRRLQPLLQGLEHYSKSIEVVCSGTPYLPWIWAPIKLMVQISADFLNAFECLIEAYGKLADALPRFDRLSEALKTDHNFQAVLAFFYSDILEFHRRAYKFVRRKSWKILFNSTWRHFDSRFSSILASLTYHGDLVDKEAASVNIAQSIESRQQQLQQWENMEKDRQVAHLTRIVSWLGLSGTTQMDEVDRLLRAYVPGSCNWMMEHQKTKLWLKDAASHGLVWLHGKPGAGKSVICASLVRTLQAQNVTVFYHFYSYRENMCESLTGLLRCLAMQIVQRSPDLASYVHDEYVLCHSTPHASILRELLPKLLSSVGSSRIIVDGIDECDPKEQKFVVEDIVQLLSTDASSHLTKILISCRDVPGVSRALQRKAKTVVSLSLQDEHQSVDQSIECLVQARISEFQHVLDELDSDGVALRRIRRVLVEKANGMFLWVSLVLNSLETAYSPQDLEEIVETLPAGLPALYTRILSRMCHDDDHRNSQRALSILRWISHARRPLRRFELLSALALVPSKTSLDNSVLPSSRVFEVCKPLIEERQDGSMTLIHFSVQEFLATVAVPTIGHPIQAHQDIIFTCVTTLMLGLELLKTSATTGSNLVRVGSGTYGLVPYALEFWVEHLLIYAASAGGLDTESPLAAHLTAFLEKHNQISPSTNDVGNGSTHTTGNPSDDALDDRTR